MWIGGFSALGDEVWILRKVVEEALEHDVESHWVESSLGWEG